MTPSEVNLTHKPMAARDSGTPQALIEAHQAVLASRNLPQWVVTFNPIDLPGVYVARLAFSNAEGAFMTGIAVTDVTLAAIRSCLPPGLLRIERFPDDEPQILEVWL